MKRIVLAYSGGLNTSAAIPWLAATYTAEVVTVTLDLGQGVALTHVRERALAAGAVRAHVIDARDEFVRDFVIPALQAGALTVGRPLSTELSRPMIAKRLVDVARMESAAAVAHGCACSDDDRTRLEASISMLEPALDILAPACEWSMTPEDVADYARARSIPVAPPGPHDHIDANILGRSIYGSPATGPYTLTRPSAEGPDTPAVMAIEFERGVPVRTNGVEMPLIELIESIETIAGTHGVGRFPPSAAADVVSESPASVVLSAAHAALAHRAGDGELVRLQRELARVYAALVERGDWFSATREAIDGFTRALAPRVTGSVRVKLLKGTCEVVS
jgi:argininosuccinate synthase